MRSLLTIPCVLLLVACGGGGGGERMTEASPPGDQSTPADIASVQSAEPDLSHAAAVRAATAVPKFGSVTQSSNVGLAGVTEDAASADFDDGNLAVTVTREDRSRLRLTSQRNTVDRSETEAVSPGRVARSEIMVDIGEASLSAGIFYTRWDRDDPTDYLAGGYWMHLEGSLLLLQIGGAEIGAFVDGPELRTQPTLPVGGTASYDGQATGAYGYRHGTGSEAPAESVEIGVFAGIASLEADFDAGTVSGCIGCTPGLFISAEGTRPDGTGYSVEGQLTGIRVDLGAARFGNDGRFTGQDVTISGTGRSVTAAAGSWGGKFSGMPDAAGDPRLVAGTAGVEWMESNGGEGVAIGTWEAGKRQ